MKSLFKIRHFLFLSILCIFFLTSCKDMCYECTGFDDGTTSLEDLGTICSGQDNGSGGITTDEELQTSVALYEGFGGTCVMK